VAVRHHKHNLPQHLGELTIRVAINRNAEALHVLPTLPNDARISVSKQRLTQSRSVGLSISDAVGAHRFPTDWRLTVRRVGRQKRVSLMRSRNGALGSLWVMDDVQDHAHTLPQHLSKRTIRRCNAVAPSCRFCCKSLFALVIKISFGCTHDFRVKMWGTSLREDKLAGDLGNVIEATSIRGRRSDFLQQEN
jgi:hypothetical protein